MHVQKIVYNYNLNVELKFLYLYIQTVNKSARIIRH